MDQPLYYDRQGKPITDTLEWAKLLGDDSYRQLSATKITDRASSTELLVSTVWEGIASPLFRSLTGPPLVFETMVFDDSGPRDRVRHATEEQARKGHADMVTTVRATLADPVVTDL